MLRSNLFGGLAGKVGDAAEWVGDAAVELGQTTWEWGVAQVTGPGHAVRCGDVGGVLRGTGKLGAKGLGWPLTAADNRYGGVPSVDTGRFASPAGTPFEMRSIPTSARSRIFTTYEVVQEFTAQTGVVRPFYGQPGGGFQLNLTFGSRNC